ncbi:type II toxin-antitoxin system death-on-curing family toxin [Fundidesulfovibrio butyratiphilus]
MSDSWIEKDVVLAIHDKLIADHGGVSGLRDMGLLESALGRPLQLGAYGEPDVFDLAAAYAYGIARNHPFLDGNKRTAYVVCMTFLRLRGVSIHASGMDKVTTFERLGKGEVDQDALAEWLRERSS